MLYTGEVTRPADFIDTWLHGKSRPLSTQQLLLLFVVLLFVTFSRRPQDLIHAQFFAEDGVRFFAPAYNSSWLHTLAVPYASYLHLVPRLAAGLAELVPLIFAPLMMNLVGAVCQVAPAVFLLSERCKPWGPLRLRMLLSAIYVLSPNVAEVHVNATNAQWHLALLTVLLAFGLPPKNRFQAAADIVIFALAGLTGPFCLALFPVLLVVYLLRRERWHLAILAVLALTGACQMLAIHHAASVTYAAADASADSVRAMGARIPLGATPVRFVQLTGGGMVLNGVAGFANSLKYPFALTALALLFGSALLVLAVWYAPTPFKLFAVFALFVTAAGLHDPLAFELPDRWTTVAASGGNRYYFFGTLLFLWSAAYSAFYCPRRWLRLAGVVTLLVSCFGIVRKWEYAAWPDQHFAAATERFSQAHPGEQVTIPIIPKHWQIILVKH